ncbi:hypothetical protein [Rhizobium leguminosarum]|uniref:hypothetical protein n=1 Tax=Rhizobium leguminosarum TaxID=384 RepID=UPI003F99D783
MPELMEWKSLQPMQDGWVGFMGDEKVCAVVRMVDGHGRWPWQVQFQSDAYCGEWLRPARSVDEAQWIAEISASNLLRRFGATPNSVFSAGTTEILEYRLGPRDYERTKEYHGWLGETGWYDPTEIRDAPAETEAGSERSAVTFNIGSKEVTGYFDSDQLENLGRGLFEVTGPR